MFILFWIVLIGIVVAAGVTVLRQHKPVEYLPAETERPPRGTGSPSKQRQSKTERERNRKRMARKSRMRNAKR